MVLESFMESKSFLGIKTLWVGWDVDWIEKFYILDVLTSAS